MFIYLHGWRQLSGVCDVPLGQSVPVLATTRWRSQGVSETQKRQGELTSVITDLLPPSLSKPTGVSTYPRSPGRTRGSTQAQIWCANSMHHVWPSWPTRPHEAGTYHHPSPGVFTTARIWPKQDCHRQQTRAETGWATSIFILRCGKGSSAW